MGPKLEQPDRRPFPSPLSNLSNFKRSFFAALVAIAFLASLPAGFAAAKTQAALLLSAETVHPGETIVVGVQLRMPSGWHTYWRNPGAAGGPTKVQWTLPPGVTAGEIQWPIPEKTTTAGLITYGYEGEVVLLVPLTFSSSVAKGPLDLSAKVSWIECETQCIQGKTTIQGKISVGDVSKPSPEEATIRSWQKKSAASGFRHESSRHLGKGQSRRRTIARSPLEISHQRRDWRFFSI